MRPFRENFLQAPRSTSRSVRGDRLILGGVRGGWTASVLGDCNEFTRALVTGPYRVLLMYKRSSGNKAGGWFRNSCHRILRARARLPGCLTRLGDFRRTLTSDILFFSLGCRHTVGQNLPRGLTTPIEDCERSNRLHFDHSCYIG